MDKLMDKLAEMADVLAWPFVLFWVGALISIGHLFASDSPLTWRMVVGRAITTGGLAMGASAVLLPFPDATMLVVVGVGAIFGTLGTAGLERIAVRWLVGKGD